MRIACRHIKRSTLKLTHPRAMLSLNVAIDRPGHGEWRPRARFPCTRRSPASWLGCRGYPRCPGRTEALCSHLFCGPDLSTTLPTWTKPGRMTLRRESLRSRREVGFSRTFLSGRICWRTPAKAQCRDVSGKCADWVTVQDAGVGIANRVRRDIRTRDRY